MKTPFSHLVCAGAIPFSAAATDVVLWRDDGAGVFGEFSSVTSGINPGGGIDHILDPTGDGRGFITNVNLQGSGSGSEDATIQVGSSPSLSGSRKVWHPNILPGSTPYCFRADFYVPKSATADTGDAIQVIARFQSETGGSTKGISDDSDQYDHTQRGTWQTLTLKGIVPISDDGGAAITEILPIVSLVDRNPNAASGTFAYVDNIRFSVNVVTIDPLSPHNISLNPTTQDLDADGLPDLWQSLYSASGLLPEGDADGDGSTNALEASAGTDPFDGSENFTIRFESVSPNSAILAWPNLTARPGRVEFSPDLSTPWVTATESPVNLGDERMITIALDGTSQRFFRVVPTQSDADADGVADWVEPLLGFSTSSANSSSLPLSFDTTGDGSLDTSISGDLASFNQIYRQSPPEDRPPLAQASRLLLQGTFGSTEPEVRAAATLGPEAWIDRQLALPPTFTLPYILEIKQDYESRGNPASSPLGYNINSNGGFISGNNFHTAWMRNAIAAPDQLRQRTAFALSQILVLSQRDAMLTNQPQAVATYYDHLVRNAFGNFEDLLLEVSLSPAMGMYLSHLGNRKAAPANFRFPDENFARELMQLFSIGLFELNPDGSRKPGDIPTYSNTDITELARIFTGTHFNSSRFGGGYRDDGENGYMTNRMRVHISEHDFGAKTIFAGKPTEVTFPARPATQANALQDVIDAASVMANHPNTAPFICEQLIQFLVTSNPSRAYVGRMSAVFSSTSGNLGAVVQAILLDPEARNPLNHLEKDFFGQLREPLIKVVHLARIGNLGRHTNLLFWDFGNFRDATLQEALFAPSVFNFFRPDYSMRGEIAKRGFKSPAFEITDSYSAISFPNELWDIARNGFRTYAYNFPMDYGDLVPLSDDIPALLDRLSLTICAGTLSARSREIITASLSSERRRFQRTRLAVFLVLNSPEGACLK